MSTIQRMTSIGLYNNFPNIFENLSLPEGIDKGVAVNTFLLEYGECPVLYPDPAFYNFAVKVFSDKYFGSIGKMWSALSADYNPIHNYDRHEESSNRDSQTSSMSSTSSGTSSGQSEDKTSAFNESGYQPKDKTDTEGSTSAKSESRKSDSSSRDHMAHIYGNVGTTTSAAMVREEVELRKTFNIYDMIADMMKAELCLYIY